MPAPFLKIALIAASVSVAAFLALYEEWPQFRAFVDGNRDRLAQIFEGSGLDARPPVPSTAEGEKEGEKNGEGSSSDAEAEARRQRRNSIARANEMKWMEKEKSRTRSFDDIVNEDGMLKAEMTQVGQASGSDALEKELRRRRTRSGLERGVAFASPFGDENEALFDRDLIGVEGEKSSRASSVTMEGEKLVEIDPRPLVDVEEIPAPSTSQQERGTLWERANVSHAFGTASETAALDDDMRRAIEESLLEHAIHVSKRQAKEDEELAAALLASWKESRASAEKAQSDADAAAEARSIHEKHEDMYADPESSFYSVSEAPRDLVEERSSETPAANPPVPALIETEIGIDDEEYDIPTPGIQTPTSADEFVLDHSFSNAPSHAASNAPSDVVSAISETDMAELNRHDPLHDEELVSNVDLLSNADSFSEVGVSTPGDWSEVESDVESTAPEHHQRGW